MDKPKQKTKIEKNEKKKLEGILKYSIHIMLFLLFAFLIINYGPEEFSLSRITGFVSFSSSPNINSVPTTEDLECNWTASADTINITVVWYKDSIYFSNETGNISTLISPVTIDSSNTAKKENWTCSITLFNTTDNITENVSTIIENTDPTIIGMYYGESLVGSSFELVEDIIYNFTLNATDTDEDELDYYIGGESNPLSICSIESSSGEISCVVNHTTLLVDPENENETTKYQIDTEFYVSDQDEGAAPKKLIDFTLTPVNDAPEITIIGTLVEGVDVDTEYVQDFSVTDEEDDPYNLTLDIIRIEGPGESSGITPYIEIDSDNEQIYLNSSDGTPGIYDYGTYNITINAIDSSDSSVNTSYTYTLIINSTNHAPNITETGIITGVQGGSLLINLNAFDIDLNETLNFSAFPEIFSTFTNYDNYTVENITYLNDTLNITTLTNEHIVNRNFTIRVHDKFSATDSIEINAQLTNTNDASIIYDISNNSNNLNYGTINITNLTAYIGSTFRYYTNYTDIDNLTYEGEVLSFSINISDSSFNITDQGLFSFYSLEDSYIGTHTINVTIYDDGTSNYVVGDILSYSKILTLHILNNTNPYFNHTLNNITCYEDAECYIDLNATDIDEGDSVSYSMGDISVLDNFGNESFNVTINSSTGIINLTPNQTAQNYVGNYSLIIELDDERGGEFEDSFNLYIENTNDAPVLTTPISFSSFNIYIDIPFSNAEIISADDDDLDIASAHEQLTYSFNITPEIPANVFWLNSSTGALRINTNVSNCNGTYNLTVIVNDTSGESDSSETNFTIQLRGSPPSITAIKPYGNSSDNYSIINDWNSSLSEDSGGITRVIADEGSDIIFNHTTTIDEENDISNYIWSVDNVLINDSRLIEDNHTLNYTNNFFNNGTYNIQLIINDTAWNTANWTWNLTINNVNRAPQLLNSLPNFTGARAFSYIEITNYFTLPSLVSGDQRFYDADFDLNSNNISDENETSNLNYTYTNSCDEYVTVTVINDTLRMLGKKGGNCSLFFNATDIQGLSAQSNEVFLNVTAKYNPEPETTTTSTGGGSTNTVIIPLDAEEEPVPLQILYPKTVVIYQNSSMNIPLELMNNWSTTLKGISLSVSSEVEEVEYQLSEDYINVIPIAESKFVNLTIFNYRDPGSYEIEIAAEVVDPEFKDTAVILVNSLEESHKGETLETKLAFARDLLSSNQDCKELYELLSQAEENLNSGNQEKAMAFLDLTINGCKYLISEQEEIREKTGKINLIIDHNFLKDLLENETNLIIASIILIVLIAGLLFFKKLKLKRLKKEEPDGYNKKE